MHKPKTIGAPISPDPKGWSDIRSAWSKHQVDHVGEYNMEILLGFIVPTLKDLEKQPDKLSPKAYARFYYTMSALVPWSTFGTYNHDVLLPVLVSLGLIAERCAKEKSTNGKSIAALWLSQVEKVFVTMSFLSGDSPIPQTIDHLLVSQLSSPQKLDLLFRCAFPQDWLLSNTASKIFPLLPPKDILAFKYFPWDNDDAEINKKLVRTFLPKSYTFLDLMLPDSDWINRAAVASALKEMSTARPSNLIANTLALPFDFTDKP